MKLWKIWLTDQSYLSIRHKICDTFQSYSTPNLTTIYYNIFARKCSSDDWSNSPIILQYMPPYGQTFYPYSRFIFYQSFNTIAMDSIILLFMPLIKKSRNGSDDYYYIIIYTSTYSITSFSIWDRVYQCVCLLRLHQNITQFIAMEGVV